MSSALRDGADDGQRTSGKREETMMIDIGADLQRAFDEGYEKGKADRPQEWIPCSERLPKYYDEYLVTLESPQMLIIGIAEYEPDEMLVAGGKWYLDDYDRVHSDLQVIAWMPLPEPWKGADDE